MMDMFFDIIILLYNLYNHVSYLFPRSRVITDFTTTFHPGSPDFSPKKNTPRIFPWHAPSNDGVFASLGLDNVILVLTHPGKGGQPNEKNPKEATNKNMHKTCTKLPGTHFCRRSHKIGVDVSMHFSSNVAGHIEILRVARNGGNRGLPETLLIGR